MVDRPPWLPPGYVLNIVDPDVVILRRDDGSMVGVFSTAASTPESIRHAAERDMQEQQDASSEAPLLRQRPSGAFRRS